MTLDAECVVKQVGAVARPDLTKTDGLENMEEIQSLLLRPIVYHHNVCNNVRRNPSAKP